LPAGIDGISASTTITGFGRAFCPPPPHAISPAPSAIQTSHLALPGRARFMVCVDSRAGVFGNPDQIRYHRSAADF
jgi:hypothetical protein